MLFFQAFLGGAGTLTLPDDPDHDRYELGSRVIREAQFNSSVRFKLNSSYFTIYLCLTDELLRSEPAERVDRLTLLGVHFACSRFISTCLAISCCSITCTNHK